MIVNLLVNLLRTLPNIMGKLSHGMVGWSLAAGGMALCLSFSAAHALTSMSEQEMSDISAQEGIAMDLHLDSSFTIGEAQYIDEDGADGNEGIVGIHNVSPEGSLDLEGITIDADGAQTVGGSARGAMVIGIPDINSGFQFSVVPGGDDDQFSTGITNGTSMGSFGLGDITSGGTNIEVSGN